MNIAHYFCLGSILLTACQPVSDPRKVVTGCLDAVLEGDLEKAYTYFSFVDMNTWSRGEYMKRYRLSAADSCTAVMLKERITYTAEEVVTTRDSVRILLRITAPEIMGKELASFIKISDQTRCDSLLDSNKVMHHISEYTGSVLVLKQMDGWHVNGDWQKQQEIEGRLAQEKLDYIERFLKIKDINVREYENTHKTQLIATLSNSGNRIVTDVEIMVTGYNSEDKPCFVLSEHPVNENTKPLQKKSGRKFMVEISSASAEWTKLADIEVVNCRFGR